MDDDFDPIAVFNLPKKGLKMVQLNSRSIISQEEREFETQEALEVHGKNGHDF